jgi:UDP-glucose 4-epimerase
MKQRILVTGGAGFIGSNFCNTHKNDYEVIALDNLLLGDKNNLDDGVTFIQGDTCNRKELEKIGAVDFVVHFAGSSSAPMFTGSGFAKAYTNSVDSFVNVLQWAQETGVKKLMYASTSSLYGNNPIPLVESQNVYPQNHYAVTKFLYENTASCFNKVYPELDIVGFRFMSVYGRNEEAKGKFANIVSQFAWDMARGKAPIIYGDGTQFRDFTHVSDVVQAITLAMESEKKLGATVFNIGTGSACTLNEIVTHLKDAFGSEIEPEYIENPVKEVYIHGQCADISKIQETLGFAPKVELKDGIIDQVKNLRLERIRGTSSDELRGG